MFEVQGEDRWTPYEGAILPPRVVSPFAYTNNGIGSDIVAFSMGALEKLRLGGDEKMFVSIEVTLPANISTPVVYQVESDGSLTPAGVIGTWNGNKIAVGGTIMAERLNVPHTGATTFTLGVLLDHMSDYVIGSLRGVATPSVKSGSLDEYGPCFIGTIAFSKDQRRVNGMISDGIRPPIKAPH